MELVKTKFEGLFIIENNLFKDDRGEFQKFYQSSLLKNSDFEIKEHFFSVSNRGVIRGMHFQLPPFAQTKLVYVICGEVVDVVLDLRKGSVTYGHFKSFKLNSLEKKALLIPQGFAHGFQCIEDNTIMCYLQSNEFHKEYDTGINPLSIGFEWPIKDFLISQKDRSLTNLKNFISPF